MGNTYYETRAEQLLAARGEEEKPQSLARALAKWLEEEHDSAYTAGVHTAMRVIRDAKVDLVRLEEHLINAARSGVRCGFVFTDGARCRLATNHSGDHRPDGVV